MLYTQSPIAKLILYTYQEPTFFPDISLKEKLEDLVDLIKFRTLNKGVEYTSHSLQGDLFDIRIELLNFLSEHPNILNDFEKKILEEIAKKYYITGKYKKLGQLVADSLEVYFKIFSHLSNTFSEQLNNLKTIPKNELPSWNGLKAVLFLQPSKEVENYIHWLEASLNFDYALITADFVFNNFLLLETFELSKLESFLKKSIIDFGSYSIITNFWHPEVEDEVQFIRNIKIKAATIEIENGNVFKYSSETLHELINN